MMYLFKKMVMCHSCVKSPEGTSNLLPLEDGNHDDNALDVGILGKFRWV